MKLTLARLCAPLAALFVLAGTLGCLFSPGGPEGPGPQTQPLPDRHSYHLVIEAYDENELPVNRRVGVFLDVIDQFGDKGGAPTPGDPEPGGAGPVTYPMDRIVGTPWAHPLYAEHGVSLNIAGKFDMYGPVGERVEAFLINRVTLEELPNSRQVALVKGAEPGAKNGVAWLFYTYVTAP